ncbi:hypothetical protein [Streptomyces cupreus]|uniref:Uncharacterized protein n=1 Tax=Streptomyces cupreus TaxID=2759956 RepID=A0A7X1JA09_9ACTN|nr:hypothetical protein [Streptomyces cupreus]MBC2904392.1 hypothetical protein [Streptomyces cupreus]
MRETGTPREGRRGSSGEGELRRESRDISELPKVIYEKSVGSTLSDKYSEKADVGSIVKMARVTDRTTDLAYDVPPLVNERSVVRSALRELAKEPVPVTCAEANERVKHLAIKFYPVEEQGEQVAIAAVCPTRGDQQRKIPDLPWDAATVGLTAEFGGIDAAAMDAVRRVMADREDWVSGATRFLAGFALVCFMPTAVIGMTTSLMGDAVRNFDMGEERKDTEEMRTDKARADFFQGLAFSALLGQWEDLLKA